MSHRIPTATETLTTRTWRIESPDGTMRTVVSELTVEDLPRTIGGPYLSS